MKNRDFPLFFVCLPEGKPHKAMSILGKFICSISTNDQFYTQSFKHGIGMHRSRIMDASPTKNKSKQQQQMQLTGSSQQFCTKY
jgi:hypothetical protein